MGLKVDYDLTHTAVSEALAIHFDAGTNWKGLFEVGVVTPSNACFTCHTRTFYSQPNSTLALYASINYALRGNPSAKARLVSYYYDPITGLPVYDRTWGEVSSIPGVLAGLGTNITAKFNDIFSVPNRSTYFFVEVQGQGSLFMSRMQIHYA